MARSVVVLLKAKDVEDPALKSLYACAAATKKSLRQMKRTVDAGNYEGARDAIDQNDLVGYIHKVAVSLDCVRSDAKGKAGGSDVGRLRHAQAQHLLMVCSRHMVQMRQSAEACEASSEQPQLGKSELKEVYMTSMERAAEAMLEKERDYYAGRAAATRKILGRASPFSQAKRSSVETPEATPEDETREAKIQALLKVILDLETRFNKAYNEPDLPATTLGQETQENTNLSKEEGRAGTTPPTRHSKKSQPAAPLPRTDPFSRLGKRSSELQSSHRFHGRPLKRRRTADPILIPLRRPGKAFATQQPPRKISTAHEGDPTVKAAAEAQKKTVAEAQERKKAEVQVSTTTTAALEGKSSAETPRKEPAEPAPVLEGESWREAYSMFIDACAANPDPASDRELAQFLNLLVSGIYEGAEAWLEIHGEVRRLARAAVRPEETDSQAIVRLKREVEPLQAKYAEAMQRVVNHAARGGSERGRQDLEAAAEKIADKGHDLEDVINFLSVTTKEKPVEPAFCLGFQSIDDAWDAAESVLQTGKVIQAIEKFGHKTERGYIIGEETKDRGRSGKETYTVAVV